MRRTIWLLALGGLLGLLCAGLGRMAGGNAWESLTAPLRGMGEGLRALALSGFWGNGAAWLIVLLVCALPLALLAWHRRRTEERGMEDWLLVLAAPVLFALLYMLINPTLLEEPASMVFPLAGLGTLASMLTAWFILKVLRGGCEARADRLSRALRTLLMGAAVLLVMGAVYGRVAALLSRCGDVMAGNQGPAVGGARFTVLILALLALLELVPQLLGGVALLWGAELAGALGTAAFGRETVELCRRAAVGCRFAAQATVLLAVFANLLQLALLPLLRDSSFTVSIPLLPLLLSLGLFLLCRCLQRGKELQDDSDSII